MGVDMSERILRLPEVKSRTGKGRSAIYAGMVDGTFPRSVPIGVKAVGWVESEIQAWIDARIAQRDLQVKATAMRTAAVRSTLVP
jgi:prophage regulatory protein